MRSLRASRTAGLVLQGLEYACEQFDRTAALIAEGSPVGFCSGLQGAVGGGGTGTSAIAGAGAAAVVRERGDETTAAIDGGDAAAGIEALLRRLLQAAIVGTVDAAFEPAQRGVIVTGIDGGIPRIRKCAGGQGAACIGTTESVPRSAGIPGVRASPRSPASRVGCMVLTRRDGRAWPVRDAGDTACSLAGAASRVATRVPCRSAAA
nr:hypothetical protein [Herbaspirillum huttiense]